MSVIEVFITYRKYTLFLHFVKGESYNRLSANALRRQRGDDIGSPRTRRGVATDGLLHGLQIGIEVGLVIHQAEFLADDFPMLLDGHR